MKPPRTIPGIALEGDSEMAQGRKSDMRFSKWQIYKRQRSLWAAISGKSVLEEWGYLWVLKAEESGWDGQREQGKVFQAVGHRISKDQMAGGSMV